MDVPNPWQSMERWRRVALLLLVATVGLSYVARARWESTDRASRIVVVVACLGILGLWSRRPRAPLG